MSESVIHLQGKETILNPTGKPMERFRPLHQVNLNMLTIMVGKKNFMIMNMQQMKETIFGKCIIILMRENLCHETF